MEEGEGKIAVRVVFPQHEEAPAVFANHMTVQFFGDVYVVTFYAAFPPMLTGEQISSAKDPLEVQARSVARLAIPVERMAEIARALSTNVERSQSAVAQRRATPPPGGEER